MAKKTPRMLGLVMVVSLAFYLHTTFTGYSYMFTRSQVASYVQLHDMAVHVRLCSAPFPELSNHSLAMCSYLYVHWETGRLYHI